MKLASLSGPDIWVGVPTAPLGPFAPTLVANWMGTRLDGKPLQSERWFVGGAGRVTKTPIA